MSSLESLRTRAQELRLHGLLAHWPEVAQQPWVAPLVQWEEDERARRSLERRIKEAHLGGFKALCDFDWAWPSRCDRGAIEDLMTLGFMKDAANVVLIGPNGVGKSTLAKNIAHQALVHGHTVLFTTAGNMLGELAALDSDSTLRRRLRRYAAPDVLVIDEVGYLSYSNRHADLLFELISGRYQIPEQQHDRDIESTVRRMARSVPQRCLRRLARRSPGASGRGHLDRRRIVPPERSSRAG